jgi:hypothetical protein
MMSYVTSLENPVYYNQTFNIENPDWELLSEEHDADPSRENYETVYFSNTLVVHWGFTPINLRSFAHQMPYTANCLRSFIQTYEPEVFSRTYGMTIDKRAKMLVSINYPLL